MEYRELLEEIIELENSEFSIEMLNKAQSIFLKAYKIYLIYKKHGIYLDNKYDLVKKRIEASLYNKIKASVPDINKEILMRLIKCINAGYVNNIEDVLIMDYSFILIGNNNEDNKKEYFLSSNEMIPINQYYSFFHHKFKKYLKDEEISNYLNLVITGINNFVAPIIDDQDKKTCLKLEHNRIIYGAKNVKLYVNISIEHLLEVIKKNKVGKMKAILCHHENQICYLQVDIHQDYVVVKDIPDEIISLKEKEPKEKQYRLIG